MLTNEELDRLAKLGVELKQLEAVGSDECDLGEQRRVAALQRFKSKLFQYGERLIVQSQEANALREEVSERTGERDHAVAAWKECHVERVALRTERDRLQAELDGSERARKNVSAALVIAKEWIEQKDERIHALEEALRWTWSRLDSGDSVVHELGCRRSHLDDEEKPERVCTCGYAAARTLLAPRESGEGEKRG